MSIARVVSIVVIAGSGMFTATQVLAQANREAAAAAQAKNQGKLSTQGEEQYRQNALARCERQPAGTAREACIKRVTEEGDTSVRGSVQGGGQIRSNTMQVPANPAPKN